MSIRAYAIRPYGSIGEAAFALVADGEDVDAVFGGQEAVQRNIAGMSFGDDEFAQVVRGGATDQGMTLQYRGGIDDFLTDNDGEVRCLLFEELEYPFEVGQRLFGEMHFWHGDHRAVRLAVLALGLVSVRATGLGRCAAFPEVRASMYACTSSIA